MDIFENICRTCGNECLEQLDIFEDYADVMGNRIAISDMISTCLPASASLPPLSAEDDYPKQICRICIKKLILIYEFNTKWVTANNEFNVALKYEQRRNRSRQMQENRLSLSNQNKNLAVAEIIVSDQLAFKDEPSELDIIETLNSDSDLDEKSSTAQPDNFQCAFCNESFYTLAAYEVHHKVFHRSSEFVLYSPEPSSSP